MIKNMNSSPKSWKSNQDGHKITNSMIIQNYHKPQNTHVPIVPVIHKNGREHNAKPVKIQRHYSEEDFKKHMADYQTHYVEPLTKAED